MNQNFKNKLADYLLDISKLVFAGVVLTTILEFDMASKWTIITIGFYASGMIALFGFLLLENK
ncbi:hypothetical protein P8S54_06235 [Thiomicrospira sp. R3]|uniref:DUF6722 family protein n=1 Tax=Thiomicrospira sp. R3 TaxID=3035472 RepID=UPI00259AF3D6|nr:DUF6722 family protein [Thiomicrospira sp. R3]WFE67830.1 hypothetical protein P8S54_06235 [Thiomicrospira sp. R3]